MSGINEIKKKAKLSIDEMYDNQSVGKLDIQEETKPESKQSSQPTKQKVNKPDDQPAISPFNQEHSELDNQKNGRKTNQPSGQPEIQLDRKQDFQSIRQNSMFPTSKQQTQKIPTYKMTFNLTEDIYKAFNDLYANRMLQGRKTEKSEMICEAIQWLIKMEDEQRE
ncbi:hypothetical protein BN1013_02383 [Candidatus Rubidus massiliensis]|nr:hypothetical protein BN1013_02383 [Candidatus Rubidus massiliensis]